MRSFQGSEQRKTEICAQLDHDLAAGAIEGGTIGWRDGRGSLVASLVRSADLSIAVEQLGIPREVLELLDHFAGHIYFSSVRPSQVAHRFMAACEVGADLSPVVPGMLARMHRDLVEAGGEGTFRDDPVLGEEYDQLLDQLKTPPGTGDDAVQLVDRWLEVCAKLDVRRSGWSSEQEAAAQLALQDHWNNSRALRRAGDWPDYPAMFRESHPELAAGYEAALAILNRSYETNVDRIVNWFMDCVSTASAANCAEGRS